MENNKAAHALERVRYDIRRRILTVSAAFDITPRMRRITFTCDMSGFQSRSPDDHIKLFFGKEANGEDCMRDYTPRYFDIERGFLVIDFALHESGVATDWAKKAKVGDTLEIAGPRGSVVVPDDFDYYLLIGDETALPAIGRRLETLRADVPVTAICIVQNVAEAQNFQTRARLDLRWVYRAKSEGDDAQLVRAELEKWKQPAGEGFVWIAAEAKAARTLKNLMLTERSHPAAWLKSSGYWVEGAAGASEK
ncbi:siderophore-interacting protein [Xanthobacter sp. TB0136]|uniref:siderophore-interacting protein n=1 Tax=Xanthobacter sp. TB0136 TaxID=3459177 RepID=UPI0040390E6C